MRLLFSLCLLGCILLSTGLVHAQTPKRAPQPQTPQEFAQRVLEEMPARLYDGKATAEDAAVCLKLIELAPTEEAKRPFVLLVAQHKRIAMGDPLASLIVCSPYLVGRTAAKTWERANNDAIRTAKANWAKDVAAAKRTKTEPPPEPSHYIVELPPLKEWKIEASTALFAVEAAYCLTALGKTQVAIEIH